MRDSDVCRCGHRGARHLPVITVREINLRPCLDCGCNVIVSGGTDLRQVIAALEAVRDERETQLNEVLSDPSVRATLMRLNDEGRVVATEDGRYRLNIKNIKIKLSTSDGPTRSPLPRREPAVPAYLMTDVQVQAVKQRVTHVSEAERGRTWFDALWRTENEQHPPPPYEVDPEDRDRIQEVRELCAEMISDLLSYAASLGVTPQDILGMLDVDLD